MDLEEKPYLSLSNLFVRVLICHFIFILFLGLKKTEVSFTPQKKEFIAQTVELKPVLKTVSSPQKQLKPVTTKGTKETKVVKTEKTEEKPSQTVAKIEKMQDRALLEKASQSLAKIEKIQHNSTKKEVDSIKVESNLKQPSPLSEKKEVYGITLYTDEISSRLKLLLKLPEYGSVTVKLTLKRNGEVKEVDIIKTLSDLNADYIKKCLSTIRFPGFGTAFERAEEHTFEIILENEV
jgi:colicin import membrane protein